MNKNYKIQIINNYTGEVVKTLEYNSERDLDRAYSGLLINLNCDDYTAKVILPDTKNDD
jgi:hypothetical protein